MKSHKKTDEIQDAYQKCGLIASGHYENFPVASRLLPPRLRQPVAAIYAFARLADDQADEGNMSPELRLYELECTRQKLHAIDKGQFVDEPVFIALGDTIKRFQVPITLLSALLSAFRQDVTKQRYANFAEVMDYCSRSANPIGRLLLHLDNQATPNNLAKSDAICSALQLINFYQDLHSDFTDRDRIYLPLDEMTQFGVTEIDIARKKNSPHLLQLMRFQYRRTQQLMQSGRHLGKNLHGRLGLEIRAIIAGGTCILHRLAGQNHDVFSRPRLKAPDKFKILLNALGILPSLNDKSDIR